MFWRRVNCTKCFFRRTLNGIYTLCGRDAKLREVEGKVLCNKKIERMDLAYIAMLVYIVVFWLRYFLGVV